MAYHINKKKVSRKWMYNVIKAQQEKINELYGVLSKLVKATSEVQVQNHAQDVIQKVNDPRLVQAVKESTNA